MTRIAEEDIFFRKITNEDLRAINCEDFLGMISFPVRNLEKKEKLAKLLDFLT